MLDDLNDDDEIDVPPEESDAVKKATRMGCVLPFVMLRRLLGVKEKAFVSHPAICVLIIVSDQTLASAVATAAMCLASWQSANYGSGHRDGAKLVREVNASLSRGNRVLVVIDRNHAAVAKIALCADIVLEVDEPKLEDIQETIRIVAGKPARKLKAEDLVGLEMGYAMSAIRPNTTAASCVRRLRTKAAAQPSHDRLVSSAPLLSDLHGYGEAAEWAQNLIDDLERWRRGEIDLAAIERNCVLAGPPGVGKSSFVRSVAKSARLPLLVSSVGTLFSTTSGALDGVVKGIDSLFASARRAAPAIIFLDELEGFPNRATLDDRHSSWWTPVVNHMLTTLDSVTSTSVSNLIVIGATNHPERLDPALTRPGRLDRIIWIDPPSDKALVGIYRQHLGADLANEDLSGVAEMAKGATGADVVGHVKSARAVARSEGRAIRLQDLLLQVAPPLLLSDADLWRIAVHEAAHAVVATQVGAGEVVSLILGAKGARVNFLEEDGLTTRESNRLLILRKLAGRAGEEVIIGSVSAGAGGGADSDLGSTTALIAASHLSHGLGPSLASIAKPDDALAVALRSPALLSMIDREMKEHYSIAIELVKKHDNEIVLVAKALIEERMLSSQRFQEILQSAVPEFGEHHA